MAILEMRAAAYTLHGSCIAGPVTLALEEHAHLAYACENPRAASITAMLAAGLARATSGTVFVGAFDPRIQPVQVKRIAGFVAHEAHAHDFSSFAKYVEYRAALWGIPRAQAIVRGRALLTLLEGVHEQFAYPLAGALLAAPRLLVLDRPQTVYAPQIFRAAGACAVFSTHASSHDAERFAPARLVFA